MESPGRLRSHRAGPAARRRGFTLLEVLVAAGIFAIAGFAILDLVTSNLNMARALQRRQVDAGMIAAELSITNRLEVGPIGPGDFGDIYPDYSWSAEVAEEWTNGFFRVQFQVQNTRDAGRPSTTMTILMYRPASMATRGGLRTR